MSLTKVTYSMVDGASVNVKDFGAVGDGVADDTSAIQTAMDSSVLSVYFPPGTYNITSTLTQADNQLLFGLGGQRATTIKKVANCDMLTMGDKGKLSNLNFDGNGGSYTGKGVSITTGNSQILEDIRISNTEGVALYFGDEIGSGVNIRNLTADTSDPTTVAAIRFGASATSSFPKFIDGLWLSGGLIDLTAQYAGRDACINNFFIRNILTSGPSATGTGRVYFSNGRVSSVTDTTTLSGADLAFSNVAFSGPVTLSNAQGIKLSSCYFGTGITEDSSTCFGNLFTVRDITYTPTWTQSSGTQPSLGDGTLTGYYSRSGNIVTVMLRFVAGSTTTYGNSGTGYLFSLPFKAATAFTTRGIFINLQDVSVPLDYTLAGQVAAAESQFSASLNGQGFCLGSPITLAAGDTLNASFSYQAA